MNYLRRFPTKYDLVKLLSRLNLFLNLYERVQEVKKKRRISKTDNKTHIAFACHKMNKIYYVFHCNVRKFYKESHSGPNKFMQISSIC